MTRSTIHREILRLTEELGAARDRIKQAQMRTRMTGLKLSSQEYGVLWERVYSLEKGIETTRLQLATAEEAAAERFVTMVRTEFPAVFNRVASRAGVEA